MSVQFGPLRFLASQSLCVGRLGLAAVLMSGLLVAPAAWSEMPATPSASPVSPPRSVSQPAPLLESSITCLVVPSLEVNVGTPEDGVLEYVSAERGDVVKKGQLLARLNAGVQAAALEHSASKARFTARKLNRNQDLHSKQLISKQEVDEMSTEARLAELEYREKSEVLRSRSVFSPINGVVVDRYRHRGDLVKQEKIYRIAQLDPLYIETVLPTRYFSRVKVGQTYSVDMAVIGQKVSARTISVDKVIDPASGTFRVRLLLPNPKYELPAGIRCSVHYD